MLKVKQEIKWEMKQETIRKMKPDRMWKMKHEKCETVWKIKHDGMWKKKLEARLNWARNFYDLNAAKRSERDENFLIPEKTLK